MSLKSNKASQLSSSKKRKTKSPVQRLKGLNSNDKSYNYAKRPRRLKFSSEARKHFFEVIDNPPAPNEAMRSAMAYYRDTIGKNQQSPFIYDRPVRAYEFLNYEEELKSVSASLTQSYSLFFISAYKGHGKTSFAYALINEIKRIKRNYVVAYVSLRDCKTSFEFCLKYVEAIAKALGHKFGDGQMNERDMDCLDLIELPDRLAQKYKKRVVAILDDFDSISELEDQLPLERKLRATWQVPNRVSICALMKTTTDTINLFGHYNRPFFHTGMFMSLRIKKDVKIWRDYIQSTFAKAKRKIDRKTISYLIAKMNHVPRQIQYLCHLLYLSKELFITPSVIDFVVENNVDEIQFAYEAKLGLLTKLQQRVLFSYIDNSDVAIPQQFRKRTMEALDEIVEVSAGNVRFIDPFFEAFLNYRNRNS
jgi:hypothetical protein